MEAEELIVTKGFFCGFHFGLEDLRRKPRKKPKARKKSPAKKRTDTASKKKTAMRSTKRKKR